MILTFRNVKSLLSLLIDFAQFSINVDKKQPTKATETKTQNSKDVQIKYAFSMFEPCDVMLAREIFRKIFCYYASHSAVLINIIYEVIIEDNSQEGFKLSLRG